MKIKINKKHIKKIKLFKSNLFLKKDLIEDLKNIYSYKQITLLNNLMKISGINNSIALNFLSITGIAPKNSVSNLKKKLTLISKNFEKHLENSSLELNQNVFRKRRVNVLKKINSMCLAGIRHKNNLPVRGQRTSTNARTRKKFRII